ncbi:TetR/AcrR family transcriptional regulator [Bifidobacterium bombi]|uniref:Transcriptional regulator, TetR family n=1 Tax=Bifidobacterium bombi DSM 19703 TaxID=1341695 RepID=A0A080N3K4_9BIFI|nr:TetR/AcrR family transcriptional regulator [Bifidobacterium bombi]KFF31591.1 transcriptional regulator, TetR family [Bifidobacterium bombi DSM 19703]
MSRNTHPEETRTRILDAAEILFAAKGYANTSVQDIVNELGNLSKGAIYHHFDSKLEILLALNSRDNTSSENRLESIRKRDNLNGLQKIQAIIRSEINDTHHFKQLKAFTPVLNDPENFYINVRNWSSKVPQEIYLPLIREGMEDGSITTDYPEEAAQLLGLMLNFWFLPPVFNGTREQTRHRFECFSVMLESIGVPVFTVKLMNDMADFISELGNTAGNADESNIKAIIKDLHKEENDDAKPSKKAKQPTGADAYGAATS